MRVTRYLLLVASCVTATSCAVRRPPAPEAPRSPTIVEAPVDLLWDVVVEHLADQNVPIAQIERASGLVTTPVIPVPDSVGLEYADCGAFGSAQGRTTGKSREIAATAVVYNVLVRGDDQTSTVRVTASWQPPDEAPYTCSSRGTWESDAELAIKARAEGSPATS